MTEKAEPSNDMNTIITSLKTEISRTIIGYKDKILDFLICLLSDGHILIEGVPGIAKTTLSKAFAKATGISYKRIQFTQDLLPSDITGHNYYNQKEKKFELRKGPIFTELLLADEINRAPPKTQSALLEAMQEKQVTIEGDTLSLPDIFLVIATLNPIETEGVYSLPEAQIDRFMMKTKMDYPGEEEEIEILRIKSHANNWPKEVLSREAIFKGRKEVENVYTHSSLLAYVKDIARATRVIEDLDLGLSPRGSIHLLLTSKAHAYLLGKAYVIPDDVKAIAHKVMDHRLILSPEAELEGVTAASITDSILSSVPIPKGDFQSKEEMKE